MNLELPRETLAKIIEGLYVAVRLVYILITMVEVNVRHDKYTTVVQEPRYFGEFLSLKVSHVFKNALGEDDVKALIIKPDWRLKEVSLNQIWRGVMYGYIDTMVLNIWPKERHQSCRPATNIEKRAPFTLGKSVYNSCRLFKAIVGPTVF